MKVTESVIELRQSVTDDDARVVRSICTATAFFTSDEIDVAVELVDERLARGDASGYYFVFAERNNITLGYACYGPIACTRGSFDLYWVVVDPSHQGTGVGRRLVAEVERLVAENDGRQLYIETSSRELYAATRGFYARLGYIEAARLADFYDVGDSKVVYVKQLA
jgi:D-alanine-D-alanine ligase